MAVTRPLKEGSVTTYQQKVALGFPDILASEMDADLDTIYAAWNGNVGTANLVDGSVTYAKLAPDAQLWRDTGTALVPGTSFATRPVAITGGTNPLTVGTRTIKGHLVTHSTQDIFYAAVNAALNAGSTAWVQDDITKPSWEAVLNASNDGFNVQRQAAGPGATAILLSLDATGTLTVAGGEFFGTLGSLTSAAGSATSFNRNYSNSPGYDTSKAVWAAMFHTNDNFYIFRGPPTSTTATAQLLQLDNTGNLTIAGLTGTKASGTTWANPSDPRLKADVAPYARGLAEVLALEPITYRLKADPDGSTCYGFDAAQVRNVFPECVAEVRMKLNPEDDEETDGVLSFDMHPILVTFVTAIKELAARVVALEAR